MTQQLTPLEALAALEAAAFTHGFDKIGVLDVEQPHDALETAGEHLNSWLSLDYNGSMSYMGRHGSKRWRPSELLPGTTRVIAVRMHYLNSNHQGLETLEQPDKAYISRYALGRDYHKTLRQRLQKLTTWIEQTLAPQLSDITRDRHSILEDSSEDRHLSTTENSAYKSRVFVDSAPVMEKATAEASGLGWIGKNTLVLDKTAGSWFFLGEIYTNLPIASTEDRHISSLKKVPVLEIFEPEIFEPEKVPVRGVSVVQNHCGRCTRCIEVCPTQAIVAPYTLDARRCISYLTIENKGAIPVEMRSAIGNRIFGCDDCQLFCPWNRFAQVNAEPDFEPRHGLDQLSIIDGLAWTEADFDQKTQGSPIRRTGYYGWLRNLAVAAGNAPSLPALTKQLKDVHRDLITKKSEITDEIVLKKIVMVLEHIEWAQNQHPIEQH